MKPKRLAPLRNFFLTILLLAGGAAAPAAAQGSDARVSIVAPVPPGGPMDFAARLLANEMQKRSGRVAIVENKPGAGALIGAEFVARARPDGTTLLVHNTSIVAYPVFLETRFDASRDLVLLTPLMGAPHVLFASSAMPRTLQEVVAYARANPGKINIAVIPNTLQQLRTYKLMKALGIDAALIPYAGTAPVQRALLANEVQLYMASPFGMEAFVRDGRMRALATLANEPFPTLPDVPVAKAQGLNFESVERYLLMAPAGTPEATLTRIYRDVVEVFNDPQVASQVRNIGNIPQTATPEDAARMLRELNAEAADLGRQLGVKRGAIPQ